MYILIEECTLVIRGGLSLQKQYDAGSKSDNPQYKVLITTSGIGSRLGEMTDYTNKSLVLIGDKPAISYIIEIYPPVVPIVITLGHFGDHVKQFLTLAYPNRIFEFVEVDLFKGPGSSLAYSMLQAKSYLQQPFIFHASDSLIINEDIPLPDKNWVGGAKSFDATNYATFDVLGEKVTKFHDKGMAEFDYLHIGVVGIFDYSTFWSNLGRILLESGEDSTLNDLRVLQEMSKSHTSFDHHEFYNWLDIGNSHALSKAQHAIEGRASVLRKPQESISFIDNKAIKFFYNSKICSLRVKRAEDLVPLIPKISGTSNNFYSYEFAEGDPLSESKDPLIVKDLLNWAKKELWEPRKTLSDKLFVETSLKFYKEKTNERIDTFLRSRGLTDQEKLINSIEVPKLEKFLPKAIDIVMHDLKQSRIHGDFILDNIIFHNKSFTLIDWREDFGGSIHSGDLYYDLAKLNHSLRINHDLVSQNLFTINQTDENVVCSILIKDTLSDMGLELQKWVDVQGFDFQKISVLTSLIWLNMAPLHHHPFDIFLYNYGKYNLFKSLQ
jgi:NDP-sugar pyrophosphorylase family protein